MPKLVCVKCEIELRPEKNGFYVIETMDGARPYRITEADKWKCPGCGYEVVAGFARGIEHFEDGFEQIHQNTLTLPKDVEWCYDHPHAFTPLDMETLPKVDIKKEETI